MKKQQIEIPVKGMDCAGCAQNVKQALENIEGVKSADVLLTSEKARITTGATPPDRSQLVQAVEGIGYQVPLDNESGAPLSATSDIAQKSFRLFGLVFGGILLIAVAGEWLGLFASLTHWIPFWAGALFVIAIGYPVFKQVVVAATQKMVTPHALMALGAITALAAGQWVTAAIVVFFMRTGDFIEQYTTDKARDSVRTLTQLAPQQAIVIRDGSEQEVPIDEVQQGDHIVVRAGGKIPVDGTVLEGEATVNQSPITGESMPVEVTVDSQVFASTIAQGGRLLLRADAVGKDSTFGKIITMVEEAEAHKGDVQRFADTFSAYYLPVVASIALLTWLISGDLMATVAVMVVACACAFALATPVALLASIGSNAKRGVLIKGGKYIEALARADVLLIDKTGTLTFGRPTISEIVTLNGHSKEQILQWAASAEQYSDHPLAHAVVEAAQQQSLALESPKTFEEQIGHGVSANITGHTITVGHERMATTTAEIDQQINTLKKNGQTVITVQRDGTLVGLLAAQDAEREEAGAALQKLRSLGIDHIELLTGDNKETAEALAQRFDIPFQAELLPEDKINIAKHYQEKGHTVVMIGDGVNDAPALSQADVGIAIGTNGTDIAIETADITLMRDDWALVPELFSSAYKTMRVIKWNFGFTTVYNLVGLSLAAVGILPPVLAAAAQSLPDVGILANSSRLIDR